jgi:type IV secretory pathway VirB9-like protein
MRAVALTICALVLAGTGSSVLAQPPTASPRDVPFASRIVPYGTKDVVSLRAQVRYTTMIVLPVHEQILDVTCGDKELWLVNANQNVAYVKPARAGSQTNLNLLTATGAVYSFVLTEVSGSSGIRPDVKVYVEPKDEMSGTGVAARPVFVSIQQVEEYRVQAELARDEARRAREQAKVAQQAAAQAKVDADRRLDQSISAYRSAYPTQLRFPYAFQRGRKPFLVTAIFHDDTCTYLQTSASELPALYELKDGGANLVNFEFRNGTYVVPKVIDYGYLAIGKARFFFKRQK